jgi:hypothetical protein
VSQISAPPPSLALAAALPTDTAADAYRFVRFYGAHYLAGEKRNELLVGLRHMAETILIIETINQGDLYVLFRIKATPAADQELDDWIERIGDQRIYEHVGQIWLRLADEVVRIVK